MSTTKDTVVIGVDGSEDGQRALSYGLALARREDLSVRLVHVPHQTDRYARAPMMPYLPETTVRTIGQGVLAEAQEDAEDAGFDISRTSTALADGPRTSALLDHTVDARYLVLGTRASGIQHLFTGSTSLSAAALSSAPVHCVPRTWAADHATTGRVVAGIDGSPADDDVLIEAFREAESSGASLRLVHAWRPVSPYDAAIMGRTVRSDWEETTREVLTKQVDEVAGSHPQVPWELELDYERVTVALHRSAEDADLLVLGRHGHLVPPSLVVGSNTRTLLRTASCPVVVVPIRSDHEK
jgi:nucleotide-binding universal stress UspA family protein